MPPIYCRCICPHGTWGFRCKVLIRHFEDDGSEEEDSTRLNTEGAWAWVPPIPPCAEVHVSLEVLTMAGTAVLLYSGPDQQDTEQEPVRGPHDLPLLLLELREGRPVLLLDLGGGPVTLALNSSSLADNTWHRIDLLWKEEVCVCVCVGGCMCMLVHTCIIDAVSCRIVSKRLFKPKHFMHLMLNS